jgi:hypothetical protein
LFFAALPGALVLNLETRLTEQMALASQPQSVRGEEFSPMSMLLRVLAYLETAYARFSLSPLCLSFKSPALKLSGRVELHLVFLALWRMSQLIPRT